MTDLWISLKTHEIKRLNNIKLRGMATDYTYLTCSRAGESLRGLLEDFPHKMTHSLMFYYFVPKMGKLISVYIELHILIY